MPFVVVRRPVTACALSGVQAGFASTGVRANSSTPCVLASGLAALTSDEVGIGVLRSYPVIVQWPCCTSRRECAVATSCSRSFCFRVPLLALNSNCTGLILWGLHLLIVCSSLGTAVLQRTCTDLWCDTVTPQVTDSRTQHTTHTHKTALGF